MVIEYSPFNDGLDYRTKTQAGFISVSMGIRRSLVELVYTNVFY